MQFATNVFVALLATSALAAPTPSKPDHNHEKLHGLGSFKVPSRARPNFKHDVDTHHEMSRAFAKFDLDFILAKPDIKVSPKKLEISTPGKTVGSGKSAKIEVTIPDIPDLVGNIIDNFLPHKPAKASKTQTLKPYYTAPAPTAAPHYEPTSSYDEPASTEAESYAPEPETTAAPSSTAPAESYPPEPETTEPAESYAPEPETTAAASTTAPAESYAPEPETTAAASSTTAVESYVPPVTSAVPETSSAAPATSAAPETSSAAPATSAAPVSSAAPESSSSSAAPVSSAAPETSSAAPVSSAAPATSSEAPVSSAVPTTLSPSFTFAPSTTSAAPASSTTKKAAGTVNATPEENQSEYLSPVKIGSGADQYLNLNFDTGSADFWVFSSKLGSDRTNGHTVFDYTKSTSWAPADGYSWKISYGDGSTASGDVGFDTVTIGGATVTRQAVELATSVSDSFAKDVNNDGLVGLGWSNINTIKPERQKTFFENIMGDLNQPLFTADLRKDSSGSYEFGAIDPAKYSGDIHYTSIDNSKGFWQFPSTSYSIGSTTTQNPNAAPAIADTGTSITLADSNAVSAYYAQVSGAAVDANAGGWTFPCSATLPDFGVAIGDSGFMATIPGTEMIYAKLDTTGTKCFGGLQSNAGINYQIYGATLLKQYFAVFNGGAKTFGLAKKA